MFILPYFMLSDVPKNTMEHATLHISLSLLLRNPIHPAGQDHWLALVSLEQWGEPFIP